MRFQINPLSGHRASAHPPRRTLGVRGSAPRWRLGFGRRPRAGAWGSDGRSRGRNTCVSIRSGTWRGKGEVESCRVHGFKVEGCEGGEGFARPPGEKKKEGRIRGLKSPGNQRAPYGREGGAGFKGSRVQGFKGSRVQGFKGKKGAKGFQI
jgi:hypothetical protein